jgi:hypothetical protein
MTGERREPGCAPLETGDDMEETRLRTAPLGETVLEITIAAIHRALVLSDDDLAAIGGSG